MVAIKFVTILLAALAVTKSYLDYRKRLEPLLMFIFWSAVWLAAATIIVYPSLIDRVVSYTQDRTLTVSSLMGLAFVFLLYIVYRVYTKAARIEYQQAQLVRKLGLKQGLPKKKT